MNRFALGVICTLLLHGGSAAAQGNSGQAPGKTKSGNGNGKSAAAAAAAPSRNELSVAAVVPSTASSGATPLAWVDDATVLAPGAVTISMSAMRWSGSGLSEVDVPIVDAVFGLAPRVQLSASVPRVVGGPEPDGAVGGVGTSFFAAKIGVYEHAKSSVKMAVTPTIEVLGEGVVAALDSGEGRVRFGLPASAEITTGPVRFYGGGGYFSPGLWFTGIAAAAQASEKVFVSAGISRAWRNSEIPDVPLSDRDRKEISGGLAYVLHPSVTLFGSVGRTIRTLPENGAGTSIVGGASFTFVAASSKP